MRYVLLVLVFFCVVTPAYATAISGRILLDVEQHGEAWYVDPILGTRAFLGRPEDALSVMRTYGLGISNADLARFDRDASLRQRLSGRILLAVEAHGEAYYVDPVTLRRLYLGRPTDAFRVMSEQGLGVTSSFLATIPMVRTLISHDSVFIFGVPFVAQAPLGEWNDPRQQDACEEASVYMALQWAKGNTAINPTVARDEFVRVSDWEQTQWGSFQDTSAEDTVDRLFKQYYGYNAVTVRFDVTTEDIHAELKQGHLVLVPVDGTVLANPYFTPPGPERHMIVITGFDADRQEFITQDPGTSRGEQIRYGEENLRASMRDYASGNYAPIPERPTAMIVVTK